MTNLIQLPPVMGLVGLIAAFVIYFVIKSYPGGEGKTAKIAEEIHNGAMVFMRREYSILSVFLFFIAILLYFGFDTWHTAVAFVVGALSSAIAGYIGMLTATKAN
ncbi:MAG: sodium/proton-translocating pyrophosphatase, partial [Gammaproteobacteria bacterium]|nr:sodium/proton-translocating pyrophosphatase [Gammaproteobacteria bacterium]